VVERTGDGIPEGGQVKSKSLFSTPRRPCQPETCLERVFPPKEGLARFVIECNTLND
jgi:hypothetical protein